MRVVKQRLLEMIPELQLYLDVDEAVVEEAGALDGYIDRTSTVLVYATRGYFTSRRCGISPNLPKSPSFHGLRCST